ncbi:MAG: MATE family efflux transporter [Eubacteriales bacterium]
MEKSKNTAAKLGEMPIPRLVLNMSAPAIVSMMVQSLYNVVDSIFVSGYSEDAMAAVALAFPIQLVVIAVSVGTGIGINSMISRRLGAKDLKGASNSAEHGILLLMLFSVLFAFIGIYTSRYFFGIFTDDALLIEYGTTYITIILALSVGRMMSQAFMSILQGSGDMKTPMTGHILGAVTNIVLDPILIYGHVGNLYFCDPMGIKGAAIATVIGQSVTFIFLAIMFFSREHVVKLDIKNFRLKRDILSGILKVALPAMVAQAIVSLMVVGINKVLALVNFSAVTAFGVYIKIQSIVFMPIFGLSTGMMPICGFSFGANNKKRFTEAVKVSWFYALAVALFGLIMFETMPRTLLGIFSLSDEVMGIAIYTMRIIAIGLPIGATIVILASALQAIGKSYITLISNALRGIVVLLPLIYFFSRWFGVNYGWFAGPIADLTALVYIGTTYFRLMKKWDEMPGR